MVKWEEEASAKGGEKRRLGFLFGVSEKMRPKVVSGGLMKVYIKHQ